MSCLQAGRRNKNNKGFKKYAKQSDLSHHLYGRRDKSFFFYKNSETQHFVLADKFFQTLLESNENARFIQKWKLKEYHYQNQTDWAEGISEEEWEKREQDWEMALEHSNIPEKSGFVIHFFNEVTDIFEFFSELKENGFKDALKHIPNASIRLENFAMKLDCLF